MTIARIFAPNRPSLGAALLFVVFALGCAQGEAPVVDIASIEKIELTDTDKAYLAAIARAVLKGETPSTDAGAHAKMHGKSTRGVFVTVPREGKAAVTGLAFRENAAEATIAAAKDATRAKIPADRVGRVRVDVIVKADEKKTYEVGKKWKADVTLDAVLFDTKPPVAFLGQEMRDTGAIGGHKDKFSIEGLRRLMNRRGLATDGSPLLQKDAKVNLVRGELASFLQEPDGTVKTLYRGNVLDGFEPAPERLLTAINEAGNYLKRAVDDKGKFDYNYDPARDKSATSYNLLRHAGTTFSMMQIYELNKDPEILEAVKRALGYLQTVSMGPDANDAKKHDWKAITQPGILEAKLGGCGLALLAFGNYTRVTGDKSHLDLMQAYARFIEFMQKPDGDMVQRYYHKPEDKNKTYQPVLYYPGEAFFGLMTLHAIDGNPRWLDVAAKGIDFIADVRDGAKPTEKLEHDHWLLYAINEVDKLRPAANRTAHADRVMQAMFDKFILEDEHPDFVGGFYKKPKTTPVACRIEAMGAQYQMSLRRNDPAMTARILSAVKLGSTFLMRNQYTDVNTIFFENPARAMGGYQTGYWNPEIQIDYVQHSTSALIGLFHALTDWKNMTNAPAKGADEALKPAA
ncbi:MAG: hypothetical protein IT350_07875 [Deltaproteobacteria bacterium]|nr:hypothetical protein [Deltaproteobacteria bacterium]